MEFATEQIKGQDPHLLDLYNVRVKSKGGAARSSNSSPNATDHHPYSFSLNQNRVDVKQNDKIYAPDGRVLFQGVISNKNARVDLSINTKDETADMSEEDFKNKMLETLWSFKNNKIYNVSLNSDIKIRTSSIKKYKSFFADKNKRLIVPYIPELLGNAKFNKIEKSYMPIKETNVIAYYKADVPITIDNNLMNIHLTVKEDNHGHFFWDAQFKEKSSSAGPATNPGVEEPSADFSTDSLIIEQLETDVKKNLKLNQFTTEQIKGQNPHLLDLYNVHVRRSSPATSSVKNTSVLQSGASLNNITLNNNDVKKNFKDESIFFDNADNGQVIRKVYQGKSGKPANAAYADHIIWLFEGANESSFMHETAHWFREELKSFNSPRADTMLEKADAWENVEFDRRYKTDLYKGRYVVRDTKGNIAYDQNFGTAEQAREYGKNELFARGFEQYLKEGQAPNNYLKQAFRSFWNWLRHLYRTAKSLNVELNDNIRGVYGDIIGGADLDFYLNESADKVLNKRIEMSKETKQRAEGEVQRAVLTKRTSSGGLNIVKMRASARATSAGVAKKSHAFAWFFEI